jgi:hypothetical protein
MHAVWSFWSEPYRRSRGHGWREPRHHWLAWALSVSLARQHFDTLQLVTDAFGKAMLVDELGLPFDKVETDLDDLAEVDPEWWALGKLAAYSRQNRPFVHLDADVFLWKPLPSRLLAAPVFAQCPERHGREDSWRKMGAIERAFERHGARLPVEWTFAVSRVVDSFRKDSCGIVGGTRADFLRHYALTALKLVRDPANAAAWDELPAHNNYNMIVEQFFLAACVDYHAINPRSVFRGIEMRYLFANWEEAHDRRASTEAGFSHLLGPFAKQDLDVTARLERRVEQIDAPLARRCAQAGAAAFAGAAS